jgi:plasmid stabilization system protein ParE
MAEVILSSAAEREYAEVLQWYMNQSISAASRFDDELSECLAAIEESPERYPRYDERYRYMQMSVYPYLIIYRMRENVAWVVAISHTSRDQGYWHGR